jgi:hypothetical protein
MDPKATNVSTVRVKKWRLGSFLFLQRLKLVLPDGERERERGGALAVIAINVIIAGI